MLAILLSRSGRPIEATDYLVRSLELKREHEGADSSSLAMAFTYWRRSSTSASATRRRCRCVTRRARSSQA
ncbi:MAG: hypothetical protein HRT64_03660 [Erythrobacter sp.]|nr:hypothetical protein [Erythrobacter sp.]